MVMDVLRGAMDVVICVLMVQLLILVKIRDGYLQTQKAVIKTLVNVEETVAKEVQNPQSEAEIYALIADFYFPNQD
jgi:hypothetical protein